MHTKAKIYSITKNAVFAAKEVRASVSLSEYTVCLNLKNGQQPQLN